MAYKPRTIAGEFEQGEMGVAKVQPVTVNGKNRVGVIFRPKEEGMKGKRFAVRLSDCPEYILDDEKKLRKGIWNVRLSGDNKEILSFCPVDGQFEAVVDRFISSKNEEPTPKTKNKENEEGQKYSYLAFTVITKIVAPAKFKGIEIPLFLRYNFKEDTLDEESVIGMPEPGRGRHVDMLINFCNITGVWERGAMPWSSNVLPKLEQRILRTEKNFGVIMVNGWATALFDIDQSSGDNDVDW
jgi:hypothetical protein